MKSKVLQVLFLFFTFINTRKLVNAYMDIQLDVRNPAFDSNLYTDVLNSELCMRQLAYLATNNTILRIEFLEAGLRIPRSILEGNTLDLGNYHQCIGISHVIEDMVIEGKYCTIKVPLNQNTLTEIPGWADSNLKSEETVKRLQEHHARKASARVLVERRNAITRTVPDVLSDVEFTLAVCVPKACTTQEGISGLLFDTTALGFQYEDNFCRLKDDKLWVPVDYIAIVIFSIIGLLTMLSTSYDLWYTICLKKDPKDASTICRSFSVYTNARRLTTFTSNPGALECVDGIRALAMTWIILGHTFFTLPPFVNVLDALEWTFSLSSIWITSAPISVDTFFMLSGLLLVYTTAGKLTSMKLLKNLHLFYLNRLLRMFPLLAAVILLQASILHRAADGPLWEDVARDTNMCRTFWWANLIYLQNYLANTNMCIGHSWYLAIDVQLHIISPLVLFWVLTNNKKAAWIALTAGLLSFLVASTVYVFINEFSVGVTAIGRQDEALDYNVYYYINTLTRASPFFVGMIFGYLLHLKREEKLELTKMSAAVMWIFALVLYAAILYANEPMKDINWNNQTIDSIVNSFMRPAWGVALGWTIIACVHGYGGPLNWFLSLRMWKLISRISYGMFLFHLPLQYVIKATAVAPIFYTTLSTVYLFLSHFVLAVVVAFFMTLIVDSPFSTLVKLQLGGGVKRPQKEFVHQEVRIEDGGNEDKNKSNTNVLSDDESEASKKNP